MTPPIVNFRDLQDMPTDFFGHQILSFLDAEDAQNLTTTSKAISLNTQKNIGISVKSHKGFITNILAKLNDEQSALQKASSQKIQLVFNKQFPNLKSLQDGMLSVRPEMFDILMTLDAETIKALDGISAPSFFKKLISEAQGFFKQITEARALGSSAFRKITEDLTKLGAFTKAIQVANMIPDFVSRDHALGDIFKSLKNKNIPQILALVPLANPLDQDGILIDLATALAKAGDSTAAQTIVDAIPSPLMQEVALLNIARVTEAQTLREEQARKRPREEPTSASNKRTRH